MDSVFDVIVIGGGPGGYVSAIRCSQLGFKVACIDNFKYNNKYSLGGTCLNVGCIPSKALLQSSENYISLLHDFGDHGITCDNPKINIKKMLSRKDAIITKNATGISFLFKKNKITEIHGSAKVSRRNGDNWEIVVEQDANSSINVTGKYIILAVGSIPRSLPNIVIDNINILDNSGILSLEKIPNTLGIIGAGVIGIEMGSVYKRLGSKVTILEGANQFLASSDEQVAKELYKNLIKQEIAINLNIKILDIKTTKNSILVDYEMDNKHLKLECDKLMVAIGRIPNTHNLNAKDIGLKLDEKGFIDVDDSCKTSLDNVYAIGDCVRGPMLAHKASEEGIFVAEIIAGQKPHLDFNLIPWVIYTNPEVAWVGKTEEQLRKDGISYTKGVSSFFANGRALGLGNNVGFVKILSDKNTDRILGVHMIGPYVSELISEAVVAMEFMASSEDLARIVHAHPTLSEVIHEASLACENRQIHG